jgi:hypothetical protein
MRETRKTFHVLARPDRLPEFQYYGKPTDQLEACRADALACLAQPLCGCPFLISSGEHVQLAHANKQNCTPVKLMVAE